ncbi:MAG: peroxiredoxin [Planctomycetota bacterium]
MGDARRRRLDRQAAEGDLEAAAAALVARLRAGTLEPARLEMAARLGHPAAALVHPELVLHVSEENEAGGLALAALQKQALETSSDAALLRAWACDCVELALTVMPPEVRGDLARALDLARRFAAGELELPALAEAKRLVQDTLARHRERVPHNRQTAGVSMAVHKALEPPNRSGNYLAAGKAALCAAVALAWPDRRAKRIEEMRRTNVLLAERLLASVQEPPAPASLDLRLTPARRRPRAPSFSRSDQDGKTVARGGRAERPLVLLLVVRNRRDSLDARFLSGFNERLGSFDEAGVEVIALTPDPPRSVTYFARRLGLGFPLLSDPKSEVARALEAWDEGAGRVSRGTVLVDRAGKIARRWDGLLRIDGHADEVLAAARLLAEEPARRGKR